jgi:hypothetical protein
LVNALLIILFLSDTVGGRIHDKRLAGATPYPLPAGSRLLQDLGFMAFTLPQVEILMPTKKPPGAELPLAQQRANQALHFRRLRIEHVNSSVKRCRVVKDRPALSVRDAHSTASGAAPVKSGRYRGTSRPGRDGAEW